MNQIKSNTLCMAMRRSLAAALMLTMGVGMTPALGTERLPGSGIAEFGSDLEMPWTEYGKHIESRNKVAALTDNLFGDEVNLYNGGLSFSVTDISLSGNSAIPVAITRTLSVASRSEISPNDNPFGDWALDIPRIEATLGVPADPTDPIWPNRCTSAPPSGVPVAGGATYPREDFWSGTTASMPGGGELMDVVSLQGRPLPPGNHRWVTPGYTYISCLTQPGSLASDGGQAFLAITSEGTKYTFGHVAQFYESPLASATSHIGPAAPLVRHRVAVYVTRIEDRHGNVVTYSYDNPANRPVKLLSISDGQGRTITLQHEPAVCTPDVCNAPLITSINDGAQTWFYDYTKPGLGRQFLSKVTLPDGSAWSLDLWPLSSTEIQYSSGDGPPTCGGPEHPSPLLPPANPALSTVGPGQSSSGPSVSASVVHPSGAVGTFVVTHGRHGRSNVPDSCLTLFDPEWNAQGAVQNHVNAARSLMIQSKTIAGPSLAPMLWEYRFWSELTRISEQQHEQDPCQSDTCAKTSVASVCGPAYFAPPGIDQPDNVVQREWAVFTHGNSFEYNEGKLLSVERGYLSGDSCPFVIEEDGGLLRNVGEVTLETTHTSFRLPAVEVPIGNSLRSRGDGYLSEQPRPQVNNDIVRDGVTFSSLASNFDVFARPTQTVRASTLGFSQTESLVYHDDVNLWVLGQVAKRTIIADGQTTVPTEVTVFNDWAQPEVVHQFGRRVQTLTYHESNGLLHTYTDESNKVTTLTNYQLGIPRRITYPDTSFEEVTLTPRGEIWTHRSPTGGITTYTYDPMGRLASIAYPPDPIGWHNTSIVFAPINAPNGELGLPDRTWKRTVTTGDGTGQAVSDTWYDALWRPLLTREYDSTDPTTLRVIRRAFDSRGRERYASFPTRDSSPYGTSQPGTRNWYDGIGRMLLTRTDSELVGELRRTYAYTGGFQTVVTNELGHSTTFSYQAYDNPSTDRPIAIDAPGNTAGRIVTTIERDVYGKPHTVSRGSLIRRWVYDEHERLCRRYDPEADWSVQHYGTKTYNFGLIDWTATGQSIASTTGCVYTAPASERTNYTYDQRNRPDLINHPPGTADLDFDYELDGQLKTLIVSDDGQVLNRWDYSYNNRRLLESETLTVAGRSYSIDPTYDKFGSLSTLKYPDGTLLSYNPNRLGQPRTVGGLATGVQYQPSGAVASFAYGNAVSYLATLNVRQLPLATQISHGILNESYAWDEVGNLKDISDNRTPQLNPSRTRNFFYDAANRLTYADYEDPALGPYGYVYDIHDNITLATRPASLGGNRTYEYNSFNRRLTRLHNSSGKTQIAYDYDANGNAKLRDASGLGLDAYAYYYDRANRLLEVRHPTNEADVKARYQYDGHARRVLIEEDGEQRVQVYSQAGQYLFEEPDLITDASFTTGESEPGKPSTRYQYLGNMLIARSSGTQTTYLHTDHLGSPIAESSVGPTVEVTHLPLHEPYGAPSNGTYLDGPGYTGHVVDGLTGLSYMQARYYDPVAGRFLGVDPVHVDLGSGGNFNRYWYGNDNPYLYVDPDGEAGQVVVGAIVLLGAREGAKACARSAACRSAAVKVGREILGKNVVFNKEIEKAEEVDPDQVNRNDKAATVEQQKRSSPEEPEGRGKRDSSKNERHGDGGRSIPSAKERAAELRERASKLPKKERKVLEKKAQRIERDAQRQRKGEEHSRRHKR